MKPTFKQKKEAYESKRWINYLHSMRLDGIITQSEIDTKVAQQRRYKMT
jgi:hypothetical protein